MYLVASGTVEVDAAAGKVRLGEGDFFGELSLLTREPRSATVTAARSAALLILDADEFDRLLDRQPQVAAHVRDIVRGRSWPLARPG